MKRIVDVIISGKLNFSIGIITIQINHTPYGYELKREYTILTERAIYFAKGCTHHEEKRTVAMDTFVSDVHRFTSRLISRQLSSCICE